MITRLPRWMWNGAWCLAFVAGMINVTGLLGFRHQAVTHLTGTTSMMAAALAQGDLAEAGSFAMVILSFMAGTVLSGFLVGSSALRLHRRYGIALVCESALLAVAVPLLNRENLGGLYAAACACGLQNAMVSTYSGFVVRTSHISGMLTDLGIFLGNALRGLPVDRLRLRLCWVVVSGFLCGGLAGTLLYKVLGNATLLVCSALTLGAAAACWFHRWRTKAA